MGNANLILLLSSIHLRACRLTGIGMAVITTATLMDILTGGEMTTGIILTDRTCTGAGTTAVNIMNGIMAKENIIGKITTGKPLLPNYVPNLRYA